MSFIFQNQSTQKNLPPPFVKLGVYIYTMIVIKCSLITIRFALIDRF